VARYRATLHPERGNFPECKDIRSVDKSKSTLLRFINSLIIYINVI